MMKHLDFFENPGPAVPWDLLNDLHGILHVRPHIFARVHGRVGPLAQGVTG